jgi:hypothetical protein
LEERYDFYLLVRSESLPPKIPFLAEDVAALGEPAWHYKIARASRETRFDVWTALPVLAEFDRRCTDAEYGALMKVARKAPEDVRKTEMEALYDTCRGRHLDESVEEPRPSHPEVSDLIRRDPAHP